MDYSDLLARCRRVVGVDPEAEPTICLTDLVRLLGQFPAGLQRHVIAEKMVHEMAEWIETTVKPTRDVKRQPH